MNTLKKIGNNDVGVIERALRTMVFFYFSLLYLISIIIESWIKLLYPFLDKSGLTNIKTWTFPPAFCLIKYGTKIMF